MDDLILSVSKVPFVFKWIEPGTFIMGSQYPEFPTWRQHVVNITKGFWIGETTITNEQYNLFQRPVSFSDRKFDQRLQPASGISWYSAVEYCDFLTTKIGKKCSLPTEAQWEYACRAGTDTQWSFGDNVSDFTNYGWCSNNSRGTTQLVSFKQPNNWGLRDMHGNVWEWCQDIYNEYTNDSVTDPCIQDVTDTQNRVVRGGSYFSNESRASSFYREHVNPNANLFTIGFRVVVS